MGCMGAARSLPWLLVHTVAQSCMGSTRPPPTALASTPSVPRTALPSRRNAANIPSRSPLERDRLLCSTTPTSCFCLPLPSRNAANIPSRSPLERDRLLHVVIVGGGPTGVEVAGELAGEVPALQGWRVFSHDRCTWSLWAAGWLVWRWQEIWQCLLFSKLDVWAVCAGQAPGSRPPTAASPSKRALPVSCCCTDFVNRDLRKIDPTRARDMRVSLAARFFMRQHSSAGALLAVQLLARLGRLTAGLN